MPRYYLLLLLPALVACAQQSDQDMALSVAVTNRNPASAEVALKAGADPNSGYNGSGTTPLLHIAAEEGPVEVVRLLLRAGADPNNPGGYAETRPLHYASDASIVAALVAAGANVHGMDFSGSAPLATATRHRNAEVVRALLRHEASPHLFDYGGVTALHGAKDAEIALLLIEAGADVNALDRAGLTPLDSQMGTIASPRSPGGQMAQPPLPPLTPDSDPELVRSEQKRTGDLEALVGVMRSHGGRNSR